MIKNKDLWMTRIGTFVSASTAFFYLVEMYRSGDTQTSIFCILWFLAAIFFMISLGTYRIIEAINQQNSKANNEAS